MSCRILPVSMSISSVPTFIKCHFSAESSNHFYWWWFNCWVRVEFTSFRLFSHCFRQQRIVPSSFVCQHRGVIQGDFDESLRDDFYSSECLALLARRAFFIVIKWSRDSNGPRCYCWRLSGDSSWLFHSSSSHSSPWHFTCTSPVDILTTWSVRDSKWGDYDTKFIKLLRDLRLHLLRLRRCGFAFGQQL